MRSSSGSGNGRVWEVWRNVSKEFLSWNWSIEEVREDGFEGWIVRLSLIRGRSVRSLSIWRGVIGGIRVSN